MLPEPRLDPPEPRRCPCGGRATALGQCDRCIAARIDEDYQVWKESGLLSSYRAAWHQHQEAHRR